MRRGFYLDSVALMRVSGQVTAAPGVVTASVCGTERDPQVYSRQVEILERAGVTVAPSNAQAAALALDIARRVA